MLSRVKNPLIENPGNVGHRVLLDASAVTDIRTLTMPDEDVTLGSSGGGDVLADGSVPFTGDVTIPAKLIHSGDTDTYSEFTTNQIDFYAGAIDLLRLDKGTSVNVVKVNPGSGDVNFVANTAAQANMLWLDGGADHLTLGGSGTNLGLLGVDGRADEVQLAVQANATQTANIFEIQDSAAAVLAAFDASGNMIVNRDITSGSGNNLVFKTGIGQFHNFKVDGATEVHILANEMEFQNGATKTSLFWGSSGALVVRAGGTAMLTMTSAIFQATGEGKFAGLTLTGATSAKAGQVGLSNTYANGTSGLVNVQGRSGGINAPVSQNIVGYVQGRVNNVVSYFPYCQ